MQQIEIQIVGIEAAQALLAGAGYFATASVPRIDFRHQHHALALPANGLADNLFGAAVGVHFRRIDHRQAKIDARA